MHRLTQIVREFFIKGDKVLLLLCLVTTAFGCLVVASTTNTMGSARYVIIQIGAAMIGVFLYAMISSVDTEFGASAGAGCV